MQEKGWDDGRFVVLLRESARTGDGVYAIHDMAGCGVVVETFGKSKAHGGWVNPEDRAHTVAARLNEADRLGQR